MAWYRAKHPSSKQYVNTLFALVLLKLILWHFVDVIWIIFGNSLIKLFYVIIVKYIIRPIIPEIGQPQQIDETEYQKITNARNLAWDILLVKEHFSYVVRNFCQLEIEIEIQKIETKVNKLSKEDLVTK